MLMRPMMTALFAMGNLSITPKAASTNATVATWRSLLRFARKRKRAIGRRVSFPKRRTRLIQRTTNWMSAGFMNERLKVFFISEILQKSLTNPSSSVLIAAKVTPINGARISSGDNLRQLERSKGFPNVPDSILWCSKYKSF